MQTTQFKVGDLVRYAQPQDETEKSLVFRVLENNGDRLKVQWTEPLTPNSRYLPVTVLPAFEFVNA